MKQKALLLVFMFISGCAGIASRDAGFAQNAWEVHRARVANLAHWSFLGRVAIQIGKEGWNATVRWRQTGDAYALRVIAPFGQGTFSLQGAASSNVVMRTSQNEVKAAADPQALMLAELGWSIPIEGLEFWVRGIPDPAVPIDNLKLDADGRLSELDQGGWHIQIPRYKRAGELELPGSVFVQRQGVRVRLAVQKWTVR